MCSRVFDNKKTVHTWLYEQSMSYRNLFGTLLMVVSLLSFLDLSFSFITYKVKHLISFCMLQTLSLAATPAEGSDSGEVTECRSLELRRVHSLGYGRGAMRGRCLCNDARTEPSAGIAAPMSRGQRFFLFSAKGN